MRIHKKGVQYHVPRVIGQYLMVLMVGKQVEHQVGMHGIQKQKGTVSIIPMIFSTRSQFIRKWARMDESRNRCFYCGRHFTGELEKGGSRTKEHLVPRCRGGRGFSANIVHACRKCNHDKGDKPLRHFRKVFGKKFFAEEFLNLDFPVSDTSRLGDDSFGLQSMAEEYHREVQRIFRKRLTSKKLNRFLKSVIEDAQCQKTQPHK